MDRAAVHRRKRSLLNPKGKKMLRFLKDLILMWGNPYTRTEDRIFSFATIFLVICLLIFLTVATKSAFLFLILAVYFLYKGVMMASYFYYEFNRQMRKNKGDEDNEI